MLAASSTTRRASNLRFRVVHPAIQILFVSAIVQAFFLWTALYCVPGGAGDFVQYAIAFMQGTSRPDVGTASREIGYPLLLIGSGLFYFKSLIGITIIQSLMAISMPVMIYATLRDASETWAYVVGVVAAATLTPVLFVKWVHHDQAYVFVSVLDIWLFARFAVRGHPATLYALTFAILGASVVRPAGNLLFPVLLLTAYLVRRVPIRHYVANIVIFLSITGLYGLQRYEMFEKGQATKPSYTGQQIFYNLYINSAEYRITLGPELGPNMRAITDIIREKMQPDPRHSSELAALAGFNTASPEFRDKVLTPFYEKHFFRFSPDELSHELYRNPNWEYYWLMCLTVAKDPIFVGASWEIFLAHPLYAAEFTLRNLWYFIYNPGWFHTRFNDSPIFQGGLFFPPDGQQSIGGNIVSAASSALPSLDRAQREAAFDTLADQPRWMRNLYAGARASWLSHYHQAVSVLFWLMIVAWSVALLHLAGRLGVQWAARFAEALGASDFSGAIIGLSAFFLYNALVTCAFSEPDYRYHHLILPVRLALAGFGAIAGWRTVRLATSVRLFPRPIWQRPEVCGPQLVEIVAAGVMLMAMHAAWAWYLVSHTAQG